MAGEHTQLIELAQATEDPAARQLLMDTLAAIAPYAGGGNEVADAMAAAILAGIRAQTVPSLEQQARALMDQALDMIRTAAEAAT